MKNLLSTVLAAMFIFISGYEKHKIRRIKELQRKIVKTSKKILVIWFKNISLQSNLVKAADVA
jgi:hypothetical protein